VPLPLRGSAGRAAGRDDATPVTTTEPVDDFGGTAAAVEGTCTAPLALVGGAGVEGLPGALGNPAPGFADGGVTAGNGLGVLARPAAGSGLGVLARPAAGVGLGVLGVITGAAGRAAAGFAAAPGGVGLAAGAFGSAALSSPKRREYPGGSGGSRRGGGGESLLFDTGAPGLSRASARGAPS